MDPLAPIARINGSMRSFSGREANRILGRIGAFWQHEGYDHWVRDGDECQRIVRYIERNPVKAGLVERPELWRWSSAFLPR